MPCGDKSAYTDKQKHQAEHIEESYAQHGAPRAGAERRVWATVNKETGGGKKSGPGRDEPVDTTPAKTGGRRGGGVSLGRPIGILRGSPPCVGIGTVQKYRHWMPEQ